MSFLDIKCHIPEKNESHSLAADLNHNILMDVMHAAERVGIRLTFGYMAPIVEEVVHGAERWYDYVISTHGNETDCI